MTIEEILAGESKNVEFKVSRSEKSLKYMKTIIAFANGKVYPTNAYVFLTGQDAFHSKIQCGMFKGTTRAVFVDKRDYEGMIWQQIEEAFQFVLRNIRLGDGDSEITS